MGNHSPISAPARSGAEIWRVGVPLGRHSPHEDRAGKAIMPHLGPMGKETWAPSEYYTYFRVLETSDEYFDYYRKRHAFWKMYGLNLPDDVLKKVYYKNALRILPGVDGSEFPK